MYDWFKKMRKEQPVYYDGKVWNVFSYADCKGILNDHKNFSSDLTEYNEKVSSLRQGKTLFDLPTRYTMLTSDPPLHDELRSIASPFFNPAKVSEMEGYIREVVSEIIKGIKGGEVDVVSKIAIPVPIIVIMKMLGIKADIDKVKDWSDLIALRLGKPQEIFKIGRKYLSLISFAKGVVKSEPETELASAIINSGLSETEKMGYIILLMIAGNETTTNLISNAIHDLTTLGLWESVKGNSVKVVEEALRFSPPVMRTVRKVKNRVVLRGNEIEEGEMVRVWIASANRDEEVFKEPDKFIPDRSPNPHLSFGSGIHLCLGAPLARLEARVVLEELSEKVKLKRVLDREKVENEVLNGYKKLVVEIEK
ncbi:cytochrome P450 [Stygiolobus caldivivus]|uniref:Cytochrome P450 n=1 Tax=Stygiolobus caldivivus TaxID=2824673 RepID=A0A8D5ZKR1_9CREN|nr:cytochrome P450 [Stygiolobus caldivivus]BCU71537.1 cytochrome P450 [Stygiolobus caldivivus]